MNPVLRNVLKTGITMFAIGVLVGLAIPTLVSIGGLAPAVASAIVAGSPPLYMGLFFGTFGVIQATVSPLLQNLFGKDEPAQAAVKATEKSPEKSVEKAPEKVAEQTLEKSAEHAPGIEHHHVAVHHEQHHNTLVLAQPHVAHVALVIRRHHSPAQELPHAAQEAPNVVAKETVSAPMADAIPEVRGSQFLQKLQDERNAASAQRTRS